MATFYLRAKPQQRLPYFCR